MLQSCTLLHIMMLLPWKIFLSEWLFNCWWDTGVGITFLVRSVSFFWATGWYLLNVFVGRDDNSVFRSKCLALQQNRSSVCHFQSSCVSLKASMRICSWFLWCLWMFNEGVCSLTRNNIRNLEENWTFWLDQGMKSWNDTIVVLYFFILILTCNHSIFVKRVFRIFVLFLFVQPTLKKSEVMILYF